MGTKPKIEIVNESKPEITDGVPAAPSPAPPVAGPAPTDDAALPDPFDIEALKLGQNFAKATGVKRILSNLQVKKKPIDQWWVRVHPDVKYRGDFAVVMLKDREEFFLLTPAMARELPGDWFQATIFTGITRQGTEFLWVCRIPSMDGRPNMAHVSNYECATAAMKRLIRVRWDQQRGAYVEETPDVADIFEPDWSGLPPFRDLLDIGFRKTGRYVTSFDHPLIKQLKGR